MRKASFILLMVAVATMFIVGTAFAAGVVGTPHDMTAITSLQNAGTCSTCHIPHKAAGSARLWSSANQGLGGAAASKGLVGTLCAACHTTVGVYAGTLSNASYAENNVYSSFAHGMTTNNYVSVDNVGTQEIVASNLPYSGDDPEQTVAGTAVGDNLIQCTSCHNVHDNATNRPFLRVNIRDLCIQCHSYRYHNGTAWTSGQGTTIGDWYGSTALGAGFGINNPGSHPVGINVAGEMDTADPDSPIIAWGTSGFMQAFDDPVGNARDGAWADGYGYWNVGRHVVSATDANGIPGLGNTDGDGVVCISCHAIHGVVLDVAPNTDLIFATEGFGAAAWDLNPNNNLLAVPQAGGVNRTDTTTPANGAFEPTGVINGANHLCERCHRGTALIEWTPTGPQAYVGPFWPNPGLEPYSHPMDDAGIEYTGIAEAFPAGWPNGSGLSDGTDTASTPICESCHVPHPARAVAKGNTDVNAPINVPGVSEGSGQFILRDSVDNICDNCHGSVQMTNFKHHPTGTMGQISTSIAVPWAALVATETGADGFIGDGDAELTCYDCHSFRGAHGWGGPAQAGMDPDWWPIQNGRDSNDTRAGELANQQGLSSTCELCHYKLRVAHVPATDYGTTPTQNSTDEWVVETQFQKDGTGTHFLGQVGSGQSAAIQWATGWIYNTGTGLTETFDPTVSTWPNINTIIPSTYTKQPWSRWGIANEEGTHLVCESCHELEPDKNDSNSKLLVYYFQENTDSGSNQNANTSYLCEGCHNQDGPTGTHPTTGNTVTRTGVALQTNTTCITGQVVQTSIEPYVLLAPLAPVAIPEASSVTGTPTAGYSTFRVSGEMSCDSCHQVHDSNSNSATYILDAPEPNVDAGGDNAGSAALGHYTRGGSSPDPSLGDGLWHPPGNTKGADGITDADYSGFCDQCHWMTYTGCP